MANNYKVCGKCGKTLSSRGFAMHEAFCKGESNEKTKVIDSVGSIEKCHACGSNDIIRLDVFAEKYPTIVKKHIDAGYTHVCNKCAEVLK